MRKEKKARKIVPVSVYVLQKEGKFALQKRGEKGLLAGLWQFPLKEGEAAPPAMGKVIKTKKSKHIFTHVEWHMTGYLLTVRGELPGAAWVDRAGLEALAVPSAFGKFLEEARRALGEEGGR